MYPSLQEFQFFHSQLSIIAQVADLAGVDVHVKDGSLYVLGVGLIKPGPQRGGGIDPDADLRLIGAGGDCLASLESIVREISRRKNG